MKKLVFCLTFFFVYSLCCFSQEFGITVKQFLDSNKNYIHETTVPDAAVGVQAFVYKQKFNNQNYIDEEGVKFLNDKLFLIYKELRVPLQLCEIFLSEYSGKYDYKKRESFDPHGYWIFVDYYFYNDTDELFVRLNIPTNKPSPLYPTNTAVFVNVVGYNKSEYEKYEELITEYEYTKTQAELSTLWDYTELPDGIAITRYNGKESNIQIPDSIWGKSVIEIRGSETQRGIFFEHPNITRVEIPATVKTIGAYAFAGSNLIWIEIPTSVTSIAEYAFIGNNFRSITIPASVKTIGTYAFADMKTITEITISDTTILDATSFDNGFGYYFLYADSTRSKATYNLYRRKTDEWEFFTWEKNYMYTRDIIISGYYGYSTSVTIPSKIDSYNVIGITGVLSDQTNNYTGIFSISPQKVKKCTIENGIKFIGATAFANATDLKTIEIPKSIVTIANTAFANTNLNTIRIDQNINIESGGISEDFENYYNMQNKKKGTYRLKNGSWE